MPFQFDNEAIEIPRRSDMTRELFNRYRNKKPVVLTDTISEWLPVTSWSSDYLETALSKDSDKLSVFVSHDNRHFINHPNVTELVSMPSGEFFSKVFAGAESCQKEEEGIRERVYLRTFSMPTTLYRDIAIPAQVKSLVQRIYDPMSNGRPKSRLLKQSAGESPSAASDVTNKCRSCLHDKISAEQTGKVGQCDCAFKDETVVPNYPFFNQNTMQLWIGTRGNVTPLHYDRNHGLLAQISGRKELVLFSAEDTANVYPYPSYTDRAHTSRVNLRELDVEGERFPKVEQAQRYHCVLQPGELLYMPPFWWHDVTSLDDCVSVTLPWDLDASDPIPAAMLL